MVSCKYNAVKYKWLENPYVTNPTSLICLVLTSTKRNTVRHDENNNKHIYIPFGNIFCLGELGELTLLPDV